jgi:hypothetical protein
VSGLIRATLDERRSSGHEQDSRGKHGLMKTGTLGTHFDRNGDGRLEAIPISMPRYVSMVKFVERALGRGLE